MGYTRCSISMMKESRPGIPKTKSDTEGEEYPMGCHPRDYPAGMRVTAADAPKRLCCGRRAGSQTISHAAATTP